MLRSEKMPNAYEKYREMVERELERILPPADDDLPQKRLIEAMRYSLLAGGKRIRPVLVLEFCAAAGGNVEAALPAAAAVEMLHTYSLIHDDLPCMDDDSLRRGKPTNHIVFGEYTAVLAGDALQTEAFGAILRSKLTAEIRAKCAEALVDGAGIDGMCGGQQLDMQWTGQSLDEDGLAEIQSRKTGSLLNAACRMGAIAAGATEKQEEAALIYGSALGAAFQMRDDILDVIGDGKELGKDIGSDEREGKTTYMTLLGKEECQRRIEKLTDYAKSTVKAAFESCDELLELADMLTKRLK